MQAISQMSPDDRRVIFTDMAPGEVAATLNQVEPAQAIANPLFYNAL